MVKFRNYYLVFIDGLEYDNRLGFSFLYPRLNLVCPIWVKYGLNILIRSPLNVTQFKQDFKTLDLLMPKIITIVSNHFYLYYLRQLQPRDF